MALNNNVSKGIAVFGLAICLSAVNWSIVKKEKHLAEGQTMFVELAPVDPRSLMQGDYMALNFKISNEIRLALSKEKSLTGRAEKFAAQDGFAIIGLDDENRASFNGLHKGQALSNAEILVKYRLRKGRVKFATNAFFFQEGFAARYEKAKYGHFRVDETGELLLTSMHDERLIDLANIEN